MTERNQIVAFIRARAIALDNASNRQQTRMAVSELRRLANEIERGRHEPKDCCPAGHAGASCECPDD